LVAAEATIKAIFFEVRRLHVPAKISAINLSLFAFTTDNAPAHSSAIASRSP
jgi:hypothetical protein